MYNNSSKNQVYLAQHINVMCHFVVSTGTGITAGRVSLTASENALVYKNYKNLVYCKSLKEY